MSTEENNDKLPKKKKYLWIIWMLCFFCMWWCTGLVIFHVFPIKTLIVSGNVVFLDKNGNKIEQRLAKIQCFSKYPVSLLQSDRKRWFRTDVQENFQFSIPKYPATLFVEDTEGKYAAVIDIDPKKTQTGLVVELRPRYSITGNFIRKTTGKPFADQKFEMRCETENEKGRQFPFEWQFHGEMAIFHQIKSQTDSDGIFSVDGIIPGTEYQLLYFLQEGGNLYRYYVKTIQIPFLKPEEYEQPFPFGDIFVPNSVTTETEDF